MDGDLQNVSQHLSRADLNDHINNDLAMDHVDMPAACGLCGRSVPLEADISGYIRSLSICGDCKFLLLEDFGTPSRDSHHRRLLRRRRRRSTYGSSESIEDLFSQQFSQIINLARHIEPEHEDLSRDTDPNSSFLQPPSVLTTPDGSRRWQRVTSDAESDGFNSDSFYGESESNVSFSAYRISHVDSDAASFTAYGGDSDASVDAPAFFSTDIFAQSMERSDVDSDSDIDPMHAGAVRWSSDDHEDVEDDNAWTVGPAETGAYVRRNDLGNRSAYSPYLANPGDYLDARGFEEFLEHLSQDDSSRQGAPPAAASFVDSLPLIVISEEHQKSEGLACAICKDLITIGTEVNRLPCLHLYHPPCILPWLSARNSCPLCRYELPTDDVDYELEKHNGSRMIITQIQHQDGMDDSSSVTSDSSEMNDSQEFGDMLGNEGTAANLSHNDGSRGRWLFLAAAPIVGLMGVVLVLWLGNSFTGGIHHAGPHNLHRPHPQRIHASDSGSRNQRVRRWWWF